MTAVACGAEHVYHFEALDVTHYLCLGSHC